MDIICHKCELRLTSRMKKGKGEIEEGERGTEGDFLKSVLYTNSLS